MLEGDPVTGGSFCVGSRVGVSVGIEVGAAVGTEVDGMALGDGDGGGTSSSSKFPEIYFGLWEYSPLQSPFSQHMLVPVLRCQ